MATRMQQQMVVVRRFGRRTAVWLVGVLSTIILVVALIGWVNGSRNPAPDASRATASTNPVLGIDLPSGATRGDLPAGVRDYLRTNWGWLVPQPEVRTNPALGIDLPSGAQATDLPTGLSDYLRDRSAVVAPGVLTAPQPITINPALGIDAPSGANLAELPAGLTDYIRAKP